MPKITELPTDTAPEAADLIPFVDTTASRTEAVTLSNLAASAPFAALYVAVPTAWTAVSFQNSWVNEGSWQSVQYRKVGDVVELRGAMKSGTMGVAAFTLPVGYRPPGIVFYSVPADYAFGAGYASTDGTFVPTSGSNVWFSVSGVRFSVTS